MDCSKKGLIKIHNKSREQKATSELSRPSRRSAPSAWRRPGGWLLPVLAAAIIFAPPFVPTAEAQTTLVSNVGQTRSGSLGLDTHEGAQAFTTGDNSDGYTVTSVGLDLSSGADHTINFTVGIWTNSNSNLPGSSLGTLTQPASLILGVNEFTTSGIELAANTTYWVVVDSTGGGSAQWEGTDSDSEDSTTSGWSIADESYDRPYDGGTWGSYTDPFKLRVTGTAIGSPTNSAPTFTEGTSTTRSVAENTASGQNIGAPVTATDADTSDTLTYTWGGKTEDALSFSVNSSTGQLRTSAPLNYETKTSYAITVSVSDGNGGADSINVTINVTDVDEPNSAPVFTEGTSTTRSVAENTASGQNIGAPVTATDADTSDTLTYTLGGTDAAAFGIVRSSGQLQTSAPLNFETKTSYAITVSVSDGNGGADSTNVTINVTADRAALVALYNATGGANWTNNTNWLSNEPLSEWHRVETDEDGRVTALRLVANGLSGEIPAELENLTNLQVLSLSTNTLSGEIPAELENLTNLQILSLSANELSGKIPAELGNLTNLEGLDLLQNTLSGEIPAELGNLTNLQLLYLHSNELSGEIPAELGDLANLQSLYLSENELSGEIPAELGNLANLQLLYLDSNKLSGKIPARLGNLTNLEDLFLNRNELSGPLPLTLSALSQLLVLDIRETTLCAPVNTAFQAWLATINFQGTVCAPPRPPRPPRPPPPPPPPPPVPDAPTNLLAVGGDGQVVLTWDAPQDDGGTAITDYEYQIDQTGEWISIGSTDTTHAVTGLVNGTAYAFQVRAVNAAGSSAPSNQTEATPELFTLDFAHFANGEGITSDLVFVNVATQPTRLGLDFYDKEGNPIAAETVVDATEDLEITEDGALSVRTAMEPLGELTISTHGRGEVVSGSVRVVSNGPIGGVLRFDLPGIGVAGVGTSPPVRDALFPARREGGGISTAAAVHNIEEEAIVVSCRLMSGGVVLEEMEISLAANGQEAQFIEEMFTTTDTSNFVGLVRCTGPGRFTGVAVELDAASRIFTTLPVVPVNLRGRGREAVLDFAHFANGEGITSDLVFVNVETQPSGPAPTPYQVAIPPIRPVLYFYDKEGNPIAAESVVEITGDLEVRADGGLSVRTEMEPLGELTISTHGQGEVVSGSVRVVSNGPIGGVLRFDLPGIGVAGVGASQPVRDALFPARREGDLSTAAAIRNLGEEAIEVSCQLMSGGIVLEEAEIPLEANGQEARYIEELFPRTDTSDFVGSVRCTAPPGEGAFTGVAVELDASNQIFTTLPVVPVPERMSQE